MSFLVLDKTRQMNCPDTIRPQRADSDQWRRGSGNTSQLLSLARSGFTLELQMKVPSMGLLCDYEHLCGPSFEARDKSWGGIS